MRNAAAAIAVVLAIALAAGPALAVSGELVIEGTGDSQGILREMAARFIGENPDATIFIPESVGSAGGINALLELEIELARTARPLTEEEKRAGLKSVAFARTPVVFVVHPGVSEINNITSQQIKDIYSGKVTLWEELGGSRFKVYPVTREKGDSSRRVIEAKIVGFKDIEITDRARTAYSTTEAVNIIKRHKNTIGYLPMTMAYNSGLKILKLDGVYPSADNVRTGAYPLTITLNLVYREKLSPVATAFVDFIFGPVGNHIIYKYESFPEQRTP